METDQLENSILDEACNVDGFDCGQAQLNIFLTRFALLYQKRRFGITTVFFDNSPMKKILGYYTLCPTSIHISELPINFFLGPKPNPIPGFRLCRLAVDKHYQGNGFGKLIFFHALKKCLDQANHIGGSFVVIDTKDDKVTTFYTNHGFIPLPLKPLSVVRTLKSINEHIGLFPCST